MNKLFNSHAKLSIQTISLLVIAFFLTNTTNAQEVIDSGITITQKLNIEFPYGHSCMTQTRADTKEEALYTTDKCGAVKYKLSKKGSLFTIYEKDDKEKWYTWGSYSVVHSIEDQYLGKKRFTFLCSDGSSITYVEEVENSPLVNLDLAGEDRIYFVYN